MVLGIAAVVLLALLAGAGWFYRSRTGGGETIDSLAVLPFVNASGDPNTEYLSDGITESLINSLSQLPQLEVMSRDSAFHYKGKDTDAETVGAQLGVRAVFKGRVMQRGDNLAISAELIDARDNSHIWGQQYSRKASDIFALQGDIAKEMTYRAADAPDGRRRKAHGQKLHRESRSLSGLSERPLLVEQREPRRDSTRASNIFSRRSQKIPPTPWLIPAWPIATVCLQTTVLLPQRRLIRKPRRPR